MRDERLGPRQSGPYPVRTEAIADPFRQYPDVHAEVGDGYRGLANELPEQVGAAPKPTARRRRSCSRVCVEHANVEYKQWRLLKRYGGRRTARRVRRNPGRDRRARP